MTESEFPHEWEEDGYGSFTTHTCYKCGAGKIDRGAKQCSHTFNIDKLHARVCSKCGVCEPKEYSDTGLFLELTDEDYVDELLEDEDDT